MKIIIETVDKARYVTAGDYFTDGEITYIQVVKQVDRRYEFLIALHEFFECFSTELVGIKEEDILAFDLSHPDSDEPGAEPDAPYKIQHMQAELLEWMAARFLGVNWKQYEREIKISE